MALYKIGGTDATPEQWDGVPENVRELETLVDQHQIYNGQGWSVLRGKDGKLKLFDTAGVAPDFARKRYSPGTPEDQQYWTTPDKEDFFDKTIGQLDRVMPTTTGGAFALFASLVAGGMGIQAAAATAGVDAATATAALSNSGGALSGAYSVPAGTAFGGASTPALSYMNGALGGSTITSMIPTGVAAAGGAAAGAALSNGGGGSGMDINFDYPDMNYEAPGGELTNGGGYDYPDMNYEAPGAPGGEGPLTAAEQLKITAKEMLAAGKSVAQVASLLGSAARAAGVDFGSDEGGFLNWLSNNTGKALLGGGVLAAILADRNKEQKLTTTTSLTPESQAARDGALAKLAANDYDPTVTKYTDQLAAGMDPNQIAAGALARDSQGDWKPYTDAAATNISKGALTIPEGDLTPYINKYWSTAVDPVVAQNRRDEAIRHNAIQGANTRVGGASAFGSRGTLALEESNANAERRNTDLYSTAAKDAFDRATGLYTTDRNRLITAGGALSDLGARTSALTTADISNLGSTGAVAQATQQKSFDKAYEEFLRQQAADTDARKFAATNTINNANTAGALAGLTKTTTSTGTPPSLLSQLAGAGTALYGVNQMMK